MDDREKRMRERAKRATQGGSKAGGLSTNKKVKTTNSNKNVKPVNSETQKSKKTFVNSDKRTKSTFSSPTNTKKEDNVTNDKYLKKDYLIGLILGFVIVFSLAYYFFWNDTAQNETDNSSNVQNSAVLKKEEELKIYIADSLNRVNEVKQIVNAFFDAIETKNRNKLERILSDETITYLEMKPNNKDEIINKIEPYWKKIDFEKNTIDWKSMVFLDQSRSSIQFRTLYEGIFKESKERKEYNFITTIKLDQEDKLISFSTETIRQ